MDGVKTIFGFLLLSVPLVLLERIMPDTVLVVLTTLLLLAFAFYLYQLQQQLIQSWIRTTLWLIATLLLIGVFQYNQKFWWPTAQSHVSTVASQPAKGQFVDIKTLADLEVQIEQAAANGQYMMLDLYAEWCVACKDFEEITFVAPAVQIEMAKIHLVRIDVTKATAEDQQVLDKYEVLGLPTLLFFAPDGREMTQSRITGFMPPADFQAHLVRLQQSKP